MHYFTCGLTASSVCKFIHDTLYACNGCYFPFFLLFVCLFFLFFFFIFHLNLLLSLKYILFRKLKISNFSSFSLVTTTAAVVSLHMERLVSDLQILAYISMRTFGFIRQKTNSKWNISCIQNYNSQTWKSQAFLQINRNVLMWVENQVKDP